MPDPKGIEGVTPKPVARGDLSGTGRKAGHTLQTPGYQASVPPSSETAARAGKPAVRRRPGQPARGE